MDNVGIKSWTTTTTTKSLRKKNVTPMISQIDLDLVVFFLIIIFIYCCWLPLYYIPVLYFIDGCFGIGVGGWWLSLSLSFNLIYIFGNGYGECEYCVIYFFYTFIDCLSFFFIGLNTRIKKTNGEYHFSSSSSFFLFFSFLFFEHTETENKTIVILNGKMGNILMVIDLDLCNWSNFIYV